MSNEKAPSEGIEDDLDQIGRAAEEAEDAAEQLDLNDRVAELEERLASAEGLFERLESNATLARDLGDYIGDLRAEQKFFNLARYVVGAVSLSVILGLMAILVLAIFHEKSPLLEAPPLAIATVVVGLGSGIALLLNGFVRGLLRSTVDRHSDGYLPPALQESADMIQRINGGDKAK